MRVSPTYREHIIEAGSSRVRRSYKRFGASLAAFVISGVMASGQVVVPCQSDVQLPNTTVTSGTSAYTATSYLSAGSGFVVNNSATDSASVLFQAGTAICLGPGFSAKAGTATTTFRAAIATTTPLTVTTSTLPGGSVGVAYSATLAATGGTGAPTGWSVTSGTLPPGLTLASSGGISGQPTGTGGEFNFTVSVHDSIGGTASKSLSITVGSSLTVSTTSLPGGNVGSSYSVQLTASGGTAPYVWTVQTGFTLPTGLTLNGSGLLSGTLSPAGAYTFTVKVTDALNAVATKSLSMTIVTPLTISTAVLPGATAGVTYSQQLQANGGVTPLAWSLMAGSSLPTPLTLSSSGLVSGTPATVGAYSFTVKVTDAANTTTTRTLSLAVVAALTITTTSLPSVNVNAAYPTTPVIAAGGTQNYLSYRVTRGSLPTGMNMNQSTGEITGTPTVAGVASFGATVEDSSGAAASQDLSVTVKSVAPVACGNFGCREFIYVNGRAVAIENTAIAGGGGGGGGIGCPPNCSVPGLTTPSMGALSSYAGAGVATWYGFGGSSSPSGGSIEYQITWTSSDISAWMPAGTVSHVWTAAGTYGPTVKARLVSNPSVVSAPSLPFVVQVIQPPTISGPTSTTAGSQNTYTFSGVDGGAGIPTQLLVNWGEGPVGSYLPTGMNSVAHTFMHTGTLSVSAKARATNNTLTETAYSAPYSVAVDDDIPYSVSISPTNGSGLTQTFTATAWDYAGYSAVTAVQMQFSGSNGGFCKVAYYSNYPLYIFLYSSYSADNYVPAGYGLLGGSGSISNGACQVNLGGTGINAILVGSGLNLSARTLSASITFLSGGTWQESASASNIKGNTAWLTSTGTWTASSETVSTPSTPSGPSSGSTGTSYTFSTGSSSSSAGGSVRYIIDWGDGTNSGLLSPGTTSASHTWSTWGTYSVTAVALSSPGGIYSLISSSATFTIPVPPSASFSISTAGHATSPWTLSLSSNRPSATVVLCGNWTLTSDNIPQTGCSSQGAPTTDGGGAWGLSGTFNSSVIGSWEEWIYFSALSFSSNSVYFQVVP